MIDILLLLFLAITAIAIVRSRDTVTAVMLTGLSSLISACLFLLLDAADVAFTEAAVGAGISTLLMLSALHAVAPTKTRPRKVAWPALAVALLCGGLLAYGTLDLPPFAEPDNPVHQHVANYYLEHTEKEIGVPNVVTAVLASYRGFDTLGEVVVVFTAGLAVLLLIGRRRQQDRDEDEK